MGLDAKNFLVLNSIFNSSPVKTTEVEKVTVSISQEQANNRDIPVFNQDTDKWEFMNINKRVVKHPSSRYRCSWSFDFG